MGPSPSSLNTLFLNPECVEIDWYYPIVRERHSVHAQIVFPPLVLVCVFQDTALILKLKPDSELLH